MAQSTPAIQPTVYFRLIALWAVCEAFAGGLLHAFKVPFTGMLINSLSVICIVLIAKHHRAPLAILKATIIVAVFKMMLSPHSPPTAYIALFFQGLLGQLLFSTGRIWLLSCILLATLTLVESSIQRILVLVIVYGNAFWQAVDVFITRLTGDTTVDSYSFQIAGAYVLIHAITGIFVGSYAFHLANSMHRRFADLKTFLLDKQVITEEFIAPRKKKKKRWLLMVIWGMIAFMFVQSVVQPEQALLPSMNVLKIILRAALIILSWYLFISPWVKRRMQQVLNAQKARLAQPVALVQSMIPEMKQLFVHSWKVSAGYGGLKRVRLFMQILLVNLLYE